MSRDLARRLARRAAVLAMTLAVVGVGAMTVKVAADWRAASAPLDAVPVAVSSLDAQLASETDRAVTLASQVSDVAGQLETLRTAVDEASQHVSGDADTATKMKADLAATTARLADLQAQLAAAQARLAALNAAAAQQGAAGATTSTSTSSTTATTQTTPTTNAAVTNPAAPAPTATWSDTGD